MYILYISDITQQIEEVLKIFAMEKELRSIKNRGYFPVPELAPEECKIETIQDKEVLMREIDEIAVEILQYCKEQLPPQWTSSRPTQQMWQVIMNSGDETTPQTQSITYQQPGQPIATDYKMTIHQTPQTSEMAQHASNAENKAT